MIKGFLTLFFSIHTNVYVSVILEEKKLVQVEANCSTINGDKCI